MNKYFLFALLPLALISSSYSSQQLFQRDPLAGNETPKTQLLLCFIDDSETTLWGAFTSSSLSALYLNSCPILISASLLRNIIAHRIYNDTQQNIYRKIWEASQGAAEGTEEDILYKKTEFTRYDAVLAILVTQFDPNKWVWYKANPLLYLLLPYNQLLTDADAKTEEDSLTKQELATGLKINHLIRQNYETVRNELIDKSEIDKINIRKYLEKYTLKNSNYFVDVLRSGKIFISRNEYRNASALTQIPQWVIEIAGHGGRAELITNLTIGKFQQLLDFIDTQLLMRLAIINTCYASGTNSVLAYNDLRDPHLRKLYSFPIINLSWPDQPGASAFTKNAGFLIKEKSRNIQPDLTANYKDLADLLNKQDSTPYDQVLSKIFSTNDPLFIPFIRPAHRDFFFPLFPMLEIGTAFAQSRTKPLIIKKLLEQQKKDPEQPFAILLTASNMPFTIDFFGAKGAVTFVSGIPGPDDIIHKFHEIIMYTPPQQLCTQLKFLTTASKIFYIASLKTFSEESADPIAHYTDVVIRDKDIFAKKNNTKVKLGQKYNRKTNKMECFETKQKLSDDQIYESILAKVKKNKTESFVQAIQDKDIKTIQWWVSFGESVSYSDFNKAIQADDKEFLRQISTIVFQQALRDEDFLLAQEAMKHGANITNKEILKQHPLLVAIKNNAGIALLRTLIQKGILKEVTSEELAEIKKMAQEKQATQGEFSEIIKLVSMPSS